MKMSLSGRLFEARGGYTMTVEEFLRFARETGYEGVELRYPQMPVETPKARLAEVGRMLADLGLTWVFGTVEGIADERALERAIRTLENNVSCGCQYTRFTIFKPEQVPMAQRFADEAARRGARLVMQLHSSTLPDNVPHTLETFAKLARPNVRLAFEPNHLLFDGDTDYIGAVPKLARLISLVSIQNFKPAPAGAPDSELVKVGPRTFVRALPGDPGGIDFPGLAKALDAIGFTGFATVMCDAYPGMDSRELAKRYRDSLSR